MKKNYFIVFDGLDGSGKSVMIERSIRFLETKRGDVDIAVSREPTDGQFGKKARKLMQEQLDPIKNAETFLQLFVKDREEHVEKVIKPFLKKKSDKIQMLFCDRYYYATIAYQHTRGLSWDAVIKPNKKFPRPDLVLLFDIEPMMALDRIDIARPAKEKFEQLSFMEALRKNFLQLPKKLKGENIKVVDASGSKELVFVQIEEALDKLLKM